MTDAARLAAAVHDVICTALADYDSHDPGDIRYLCDPAPFRASMDRIAQPAAPAEGLDVARDRLIGRVALVLDGEGGWERQSRAAIVRCIDEVFDPIIRAAKRADR